MASVLVHIELDGSAAEGRRGAVDGAALHAASRSALAAARAIASSWGATVYAAMIVRDPAVTIRDARIDAPVKTLDGLADVQAAIARAGADKLVVATTDVAIAPTWSALGDPWLAVLDYVRPRIVLFGADDPTAAELVMRTASHLGAQLMVDVRVAGEPIALRDRDDRSLAIGDFQLVVGTVAAGAAVAAIPGAHDAVIDVIRIVAPHGAPRAADAPIAPAASPTLPTIPPAPDERR